MLFFALYAFAYTPLGDRSALEHLLAVLRTPQATHAGEQLTDAARRLRSDLGTDQVTLPGRGAPTLPTLGPEDADDHGGS